MPIDEEGCWNEEEDGAGDGAEAEPAKKEAHNEGRQGFELWRSIARVVCLTVNVRAPGVLSKLQAEMRFGRICGLSTCHGSSHLAIRG